MKLARIHAVVPILPLTLVTLLAGTAGAPTFVPKEGVAVKRTLEMKGKRELQSQAMEMGDERQTNPNAHLDVDLGWKHVVTDKYEKCAGDRIELLKRTFESLARGRTEKSKDQEGADTSKEVVETCDLEGKTVSFAWNPEKKAYKKSFDGEGDETLLHDLDLDMDYREFLPESDAKVGTKWERDFADLKLYLLRPGGDLPFHSDKPTRPMDSRMRNAAWDATKGKIEFELKPATEEAGRNLGHIHFEGVLKVDASADAEAGEKGPQKLELRDEQTFEGELVWDLDAHCAHGIEWNSKGTMVLKVSLPVQTKDGEERTLVQAFTFDETYDYTGSFEAQ